MMSGTQMSPFVLLGTAFDHQISGVLKTGEPPVYLTRSVEYFVGIPVPVLES
jgi:hypothetical protein